MFAFYVEVQFELTNFWFSLAVTSDVFPSLCPVLRWTGLHFFFGRYRFQIPGLTPVTLTAAFLGFLSALVKYRFCVSNYAAAASLHIPSNFFDYPVIRLYVQICVYTLN
jgi:hypothetical protein